MKQNRYTLHKNFLYQTISRDSAHLHSCSGKLWSRSRHGKWGERGAHELLAQKCLAHLSAAVFHPPICTLCLSHSSGSSPLPWWYKLCPLGLVLKKWGEIEVKLQDVWCAHEKRKKIWAVVEDVLGTITEGQWIQQSYWLLWCMLFFKGGHIRNDLLNINIYYLLIIFNAFLNAYGKTRN